MVTGIVSGQLFLSQLIVWLIQKHTACRTSVHVRCAGVLGAMRGMWPVLFLGFLVPCVVSAPNPLVAITLGGHGAIIVSGMPRFDWLRPCDDCDPHLWTRFGRWIADLAKIGRSNQNGPIQVQA